MGRPKKKQLTEKEENFCQKYVQCLNYGQAILDAGYETNLNNARKLGWKYMQKKHIRDRVNELKKEIRDMILFEKLETIDTLIRIITDKNTKTKDILKAIEILNRMQGYNEPEKIDNSMNIVIQEESYSSKDK